MHNPSLHVASGSEELLALLHAIHRDVSGLEFPFAVPARAEHEDLRDRVLTSISSHLLPRLADGTAPAVVVLGGSTGAGKSTLLNSLVGREITPAGVLRPTTRRAVAAHHPETHAVPMRDLADAVADPSISRAMVLVDAPDLDSLERDNRAAATRLLEVADLWMIVTTAARYGDRLPWNALVRAKERGLQIGVILNRVPKKARKAVRRDLLRRLERIGLAEAPIFLLDDLSPHEGLLPEHMVEDLRDWLQAAIGLRQASSIVRRTAAGAWPQLVRSVRGLAEAAREQAAAAEGLRSQTMSELQRPESDIEFAIEHGSCAVGAPAARWAALAAPGGPLVAGAFKGRGRTSPEKREARARALGQLGEDLRAATVTLLADALLDAAVTIDREWRGAKALALLKEPVSTSAAEARRHANEALDAWYEDMARVLDQNLPSDALTSRLGLEGVSHFLAAAATKVEGVSEVAEAALGASAIEAARAALVQRAHGALRAVAAPYLSALREVTGDDSLLDEQATTLERLIHGQ